MTLKTSSVKTHPVVNFFKFSLRKQTPLTLLVFAFTLLICPGMLIRSVISDFSAGWSGKFVIYNDAFAFWSAFILGASVLLMFMLLLSNFGFLFSKKAGDMFHALPLTRNEMLATRTLSSYIGSLFNMTVSYVGLCMVNSMPFVDGVPAKTMIMAYLLMVLFLLALTLYCLLFVVCSGGYFDAVIALAAVNLGPIFIAAMLILFATENTVGLDLGYESLIYTSPVYFMFYKLVCLPVAVDADELIPLTERASVWTVIGVLVFTIACAVLAERLFRVRKSETAGEAYSFKFVPFIITLLVAMVGGYLVGGIMTGFDSHLNIFFWVLFIVGALLCAVAFGAITSRGFKTVRRSLLNGAVAAVVMVALVSGTTLSANIAEVYLPEKDEIAEIRLGYDEEIVFTENFDIILDIHTKIVDNIKNDYNYDGSQFEFFNNANDLNITYIMKNGSAVRRDYWLGFPEINNIKPELLRLMQSDEFLSKYTYCVQNPMNMVYINILGEKYGYVDTVYGDKTAVLNNEQGREFLQILKSEMKAADVSVFSETCVVLSLSGERYEDIYIPTSFTQTLEYLTHYFVSEEESTTMYVK